MNTRELKEQARRSLENPTYSPSKLILIHTGAVLMVSLLLTLADALLNLGIGSTGGLSGVGNRAALETAQTVLSLARTVLLPFWQVGWIYASMALLRKQNVNPDTLLMGFRRFGPVLRLTLLEGIWLFILMMAGIYLGSMLFTFTPWAADVLIWMETGVLPSSVAILLILCMTLALVFTVPAAFRLRLSHYYLMDHPELGAMAAMQLSRKTMRGNCLKVLKLDFSFWWFFALELVSVVLLYANQLWKHLLTDTGSVVISYIVAVLTSSAVQLAVYAKFKPYMDVTYAACYEALIPEEWNRLQEKLHESDTDREF